MACGARGAHVVNLESRFKTNLVDECKKLGAYARRHEDRYAIGLLDLSIKFPGHPHLEAEGKLVEHQKFAPTLRQYEEGERYRAAGGLCALIGWEPKTKAMFIHPWARWAMKEDSFPPGGAMKAHAETLKEWLDWQATK
jgi:hypothetical protein